MRSLQVFFSVILVALLPVFTKAQDSSNVQTKPRIALFAPLYLDSAFDGANEYRYAKNTFPKFINPGLEFYEGAQLALDSLAQEGAELEVYIYDTRSAKESLENQLAKAEADSVDLIIAHCSGNEVRTFSEFGLKKNIPVINTTIPNDGGASGNPYFVLLNPTLKTQVEGVYKYVQKYHALDQAVVFRKKGVNEDQIKSILEDYSRNALGSQIKLKYVDLVDSFTINQLRAQFDTAKKVVCIAGSLDVNFGRRLAPQLATLNKKGTITVLGMPTWESIRDFNRPEFKGLEIVYSNPFYNAKTDKVSQEINNYFNTTMFARPSDMVFRGYEVTYKFARLLLQYRSQLSSNLGNKQYKVFTDFDIQPVLSKGSMTLQYFENKRLYFLKWQDGIIKSVNW